MRKGETPEQFGQRMREARAASAALKAASAAQGATEMASGTSVKFAGREDVPAGVRPIAERPVVVGREVDAGTVAGLQQAPDTGFGGSAVAVEVASHEVIGGNISVNRPGKRTGDTIASKGNASAVLFSDKKDDGGLPRQLQRSQGRSGAVEPTGLPCSCAYDIEGNRLLDEKGKPKGMASYKRGQDPAITWCTVCGGERDGVARPENALRSTAAQAALGARGVQVDVDSIAERVHGMIDYDAIANAVATAVLQKLQPETK
jgi:hypothetical protein